ncbi:hypothetical protein [Microtetraspora sp. NBRC 13810]|uniref:hypothetical protein n=1 Tax=Microtetraspora sp. NBRC 13810 TaxID=3030990 RepID=UPI002552FA88|nr:hypothetical protein [Microtetraspora sp. NBRC 13810]
MAVLLTTGDIVFAVLAPASMTKPASLVLVLALLIGYLSAALRSIYRTRRAASRKQAHPEHPQPPHPPAP